MRARMGRRSISSPRAPRSRSGTRAPPSALAGRRSGAGETGDWTRAPRRRSRRWSGSPRNARLRRASISGWPMDRKQRCSRVTADPLYIRYHDEEWGRPVHDDRTHFEFLILEGAQAGLSWSTVLRKREGYRKAFDGFDPARVARFTPARILALLQNPAIIRNRAK